ncbi:MAG: hypothetical protein IJ331_06355 [Ruminococcus sp.]|nr:hypothetical protein [Ruminococcus sp.]
MKKTLPVLCVLMAILTIIIAMTTMSYSWFEPDIKEGIGLQYKDEAQLRDEHCAIVTYSGAYNNTMGSTGYGLVLYGDQITTADVTVNEGETVYYKTVIENSSEKYDTVVSLFLPSFTITGGNASIGVAFPTNSFRTFSANQTDIHIIRNAHVKMFVDTDANPGQLSVEWFVKCESGSVTFNPSQVYLMYS